MPSKKTKRVSKNTACHHRRQNAFLKTQRTKLLQFMENKCIAWSMGTVMTMFNAELEKITPTKETAIALNICRVPWNIYAVVITKSPMHGYAYLIDQIKTTRDFLYEDIGTRASDVHTRRLAATNKNIVCGVGWVARIDNGELDDEAVAEILTILGHKEYLAPWEKVPTSTIEEQIEALLIMQEEKKAKELKAKPLNPWHKNMP